MLETVVYLHLPTGKTRALRALVDTGASDNYLHTRVSDEYDIEVLKFANPTTVTLGSKESADTPGETNPLTLSCGRSVLHKSNFTLLDLDEYDLVLGRPFQKFANVLIMSKMDALQVPTPHGMQELQRWVSTPKGKPQLQFLSRLDMLREMRGSKETYLLQHEGSTDQPPPSPETAEEGTYPSSPSFLSAYRVEREIEAEAYPSGSTPIVAILAYHVEWGPEEHPIWT